MCASTASPGLVKGYDVGEGKTYTYEADGVVEHPVVGKPLMAAVVSDDPGPGEDK